MPLLSKQTALRSWVILLTAALVVGCQVVDDKEKKNSDQQQNSGISLAGTWNGLMKQINKKQDSDDAIADEDSDLSGDQEVYVVITEPQNGVGQLTVKLARDESAQINGEYDTFSNEYLLVRIKTSSYSLLGVANQLITMDYVLSGNRLTLTTDQKRMYLKRSDGKTTPSTAPGESWTCESGETQWEFVFNDSTFSALAARGNTLVRMAGLIEAKDDGSILLTVSSSRYTEYKGAQLAGSYTSDDAGTKTSLALSSEEFGDLACVPKQ